MKKYKVNNEIWSYIKAVDYSFKKQYILRTKFRKSINKNKYNNKNLKNTKLIIFC